MLGRQFLYFLKGLRWRVDSFAQDFGDPYLKGLLLLSQQLLLQHHLEPVRVPLNIDSGVLTLDLVYLHQPLFRKVANLLLKAL